MAYQIPKDKEEYVKTHLDFREKGGYEKINIMFYPQDTDCEPFKLNIYIGTQTNPFYLGPAGLEEIAEQIYRSEGPSGKNTEYLFELANAIRKLAPADSYDEHLFELEQEVRKLCDKHGQK